MKLMKQAVLAIALAMVSISAAQAEVITIDRKFVVKSDVVKVHDFIVNYANYKALDHEIGKSLLNENDNFIRFTKGLLITLNHSQTSAEYEASRKASLGKKVNTGAGVYIEFAPLGMGAGF